jgi:hypothetical protein
MSIVCLNRMVPFAASNAHICSRELLHNFLSTNQGSGFLSAIGDTVTLVGDSYVSLLMLISGAALYFDPPPIIVEPTPTQHGEVDGEVKAHEEEEEEEEAYHARKGTTLPRKEGPFRDDGTRRGDSRPMAKARTIAALCGVRLVLLPAIGFMIVFWAMKLGLLGTKKTDGIRVLVTYIQWAVPSAQTCIVFLSTLQYHDLAHDLAIVYVVMYPLSVVTLTAWTSVALFLVEEYIWEDEERVGGGVKESLSVALGSLAGVSGFAMLVAGLYCLVRREWKKRRIGGAEMEAFVLVEEFRFTDIFQAELEGGKRRATTMAKLTKAKSQPGLDDVYPGEGDMTVEMGGIQSPAALVQRSPLR